MQNMLRLAFPPQCLACGDLVETEFGLCGACWKGTNFLTGHNCDRCGVPLPEGPGTDTVTCDDCMTIARPWLRGRSTLAYTGTARRLILGLKHGDRLDLVKPLSVWMAGAAEELLYEDSVIVPVPLYNSRLLRRRYNQAALLGNALAKEVGRETIPDLLTRTRSTKMQEGMKREERFENQKAAIQPSRHAALKLAGRPVLLVDDVMTSGATLSASAEACHAIGARRVDVLTLARVIKDA